MKLLTLSWRVALLCLVAGLAWGQELEIIDLHYRTAPEVIPVLQPLVEPGGALSGTDYKLFVRASPANVAQIRRALEQIDRQPRSLLVSVRRATRQAIERESAEAAVVIGNRGSGAALRATDAASQANGSSISSVHVLEGASAFVSTGRSIPLVTAVVAGGRKPWVGASTSHSEVNTGFIVTPRVSAQRVTLDIEQRAEQVGANNQSIETQRISTQASGAIGEWISLGGVSESTRSQSSGILSRSYATQSDDLEVWVRVEER
ncbi:secretin N-terminal domain-containing protein [Povalibacter sp.]|uniref:secretin N-terminal domain-containing protein n=1 Tax=Povalibacter sp. TaxID=1962978 RepID=UPI002F40ED82